MILKDLPPADTQGHRRLPEGDSVVLRVFELIGKRFSYAGKGQL